MPIDPATPRFPLHEQLARFFTADPRRRVAVAHLAELLGITTEMFCDVLEREGLGRPSETLPWPEAAAWLFDAWPRALLLDTLGPSHARRVPRQFHPTRVNWSIPIFIVRAMEHQAAVEWRRDPRLQRSVSPNHTAGRGIDDYVTDLLFNAIEPRTVAVFRDDAAFLDAYQFPGGD